LVAAGLRLVPCFATICNVVVCKNAGDLTVPDNRSKFNVALGIEAQGFCVLR
jgi:hypothetical protein